MKLKTMLIPVGALVLALGVGGLPVEAGQRDRNGRDRNGRESGGQVRERGDVQQRGGGRDGGEQRSAPPVQQAAPPVQQDRGGRYQAPAPDRRSEGYAREREYRGNYESRGYNNRGYDNRGYDNRGYDRRAYEYRGYDYRGPRGYAPYGGARILRPGHYYGPGGGFSVYFGLGSGYLYGSPWSGRVYGYMAPRAYGARIYFGDVRLQVQPRDAEVYVDGYYAGIVDDFDGVFQRLTLEVGPHQIELDAPGIEPQTFDIYVDPARTVNLHADLFRY